MAKNLFPQSPPPIVFAFTVLPRFWQPAWFRGLGFSGIILLTGAGVWYGRHRRMRRKLERVEHQCVLERKPTRIAKDIHDDLGASLTRINRLSQSGRRGLVDPPQMEKTSIKSARPRGS